MVVEYYSRTGRDLTAANMTWIRLDNFRVEFDTLKDRKKNNDDDFHDSPHHTPITGDR